MDTTLKPGVQTTEFKMVMAFLASPFLQTMSGGTPSPWLIVATVVVAGLYVIARGFSKLGQPGDDSALNATETWTAAGAALQALLANAQAQFNPTWTIAATVYLCACFFLSRLMAKTDVVGIVRKMLSKQETPKQALQEIVREVIALSKPAVA